MSPSYLSPFLFVFLLERVETVATPLLVSSWCLSCISISISIHVDYLLPGSAPDDQISLSPSSTLRPPPSPTPLLPPRLALLKELSHYLHFTTASCTFTPPTFNLEKNMFLTSRLPLASRPCASRPSARCVRFLSSSSSLSSKQTGLGVTWEDVSRSGCENPDSKVGLYAGDEESYELFWREFKPVIEKCHNVSIPREVSSITRLAPGVTPLQPGHDFTCPSSHVLTTLSDPSSTNIVDDCRVRVARNLKGFRFPSCATREDRAAVRSRVQDVVLGLDLFRRGFMIEMGKENEAPQEIRLRLEDGSVPVFHNEDKHLASAGAYSEWPQDRVALVSDDFSTSVWINEEDHIRVMAVERGLRLDSAVEKVAYVISELDTHLGFAHSPYLGYLSSCPSNLGTGMRSSAQISFKNTSLSKDEIEQLLEIQKKQNSMQIRSSRGETFKDFSDGLFNLSFTKRLGVYEKDIMQRLLTCVEELDAELK